MKTRIGVSILDIVLGRILSVPILLLWVAIGFGSGTFVAFLPLIWFFRFWILMLLATSNVYLLPDQITIGKKNILVARRCPLFYMFAR